MTENGLQSAYIPCFEMFDTAKFCF